jgi:hypothetical protein
MSTTLTSALNIRMMLRINSKRGEEALAMGKGCRFFQVSALSLALACVVLASQPAYAETLSCPDVTLTEGKSGDMTCTFKNNTSGNITLNTTDTFDGTPVVFLSGDVNDVARSSGISSPCTPGETLSAGSSCKFTIHLTTDSPAGETDTDFGKQLWQVSVVIEEVPNFFPVFPTVTVNDPGAPVPEPASVVLLGIGSGLLGALGLLRRRLKGAKDAQGGER